MNNRQKITVQTVVHAPIEKAWEYWTMPKHITQWNAASDDWHTPRAINDLRVGGTFTCRMEARDQSAGFDFSGTYTQVDHHTKIAYKMEDAREVEVTFETIDEGTKITEAFDAETLNSPEMQRNGWQAILDRFKKYVESHA